jgi:hypothetical protein
MWEGLVRRKMVVREVLNEGHARWTSGVFAEGGAEGRDA